MKNNVKKYFVLFVATFVLLTGCACTETIEENSVVPTSSSQVDKVAEPGETKYFITFSIGQSHFTLSIGELIKDDMNETTLTVMVDKDYYDSFEIGDTVNDEFRWGSYIAKGSIGNWDVKISDKYTVTE